MVKKILIGIMLFFMAVSVPIYIPACNSSPTGHTGTSGPAINTPTNNYYVSVMVVSLGGLGGCIMGGVSKDSSGIRQPVMDAQVTVNGVPLDTMGTTYYKSSVAVNPGTTYDLKVMHNGSQMASGNTIMPGVPVLTAPTASTHAMNTPITVSWNQVDYATAFSFGVTYSDTIQSVTDSSIYSPATLASSATSLVVPASVFSGAGTYVLTLTAVNGIPSGLDQNNVDSTKGYNITGAAGVFMAANPVSDTVYVNYNPTKKTATPKRGSTGSWSSSLTLLARKMFGVRR